MKGIFPSPLIRTPVAVSCPSNSMLSSSPAVAAALVNGIAASTSASALLVTSTVLLCPKKTSVVGVHCDRLGSTEALPRVRWLQQT